MKITVRFLILLSLVCSITGQSISFSQAKPKLSTQVSLSALKEDELYLEILAEQFGRLYFFIPILLTLVERGGAGSYIQIRIFTWEELEKKVLLIWENPGIIDEKSQEYKRAPKNVIPDSMVHSFKIEAEPHASRKSILICLDDCFFDLHNSVLSEIRIIPML